MKMLIFTIFCSLLSMLLLGGIMYKAGECDREIDHLDPEDLKDK